MVAFGVLAYKNRPLFPPAESRDGGAKVDISLAETPQAGKAAKRHEPVRARSQRVQSLSGWFV